MKTLTKEQVAFLKERIEEVKADISCRANQGKQINLRSVESACKTCLLKNYCNPFLNITKMKKAHELLYQSGHAPQSEIIIIKDEGKHTTVKIDH